MTNAKGVLEWMAWEKKRKANMTNEEWFCGLSTEEKAKYIAKAMFFYDSKFKLTLVEALRTATRYEQGLNKTLENDVVDWLKEKHHDSVQG